MSSHGELDDRDDDEHDAMPSVSGSSKNKPCLGICIRSLPQRSSGRGTLRIILQSLIVSFERQQLCTLSICDHNFAQ